MADPERPDTSAPRRPTPAASASDGTDLESPADKPTAERAASEAEASAATVERVVRDLDEASGDGRLDVDGLNTLRARLDELAELHVANQSGQVHDLMRLMSSKRRLMSVNFLAGLSRGVGFFLGVTLIGGLLIGGMAMAFDYAASSFGMPDITFSAIVRRMAEKSVEALDVWKSVQAERAEGPPENQLEPMPAAGGEVGDPELQSASDHPPPDDER